MSKKGRKRSKVKASGKPRPKTDRPFPPRLKVEGVRITKWSMEGNEDA